MSKKFKIFLGIITQNQEDNIRRVCESAKYFDGIFGVVHQPSNDRTFEILEENKGEGEIIRLPYLQRNDFSMNAFLFNPKLFRENWIALADSTEIYNLEFAKNIQSLLLNLEKNNIHYVYHYSKLMLFKKKDEHFFFGHPHWALINREQNAIAIEQYIPNDKDVRYSIRNQTRPKDHYIRHFVKYLLHAGYSNHMLLGNENNLDEYHRLEQLRRKFLTFCLEELRIDLTVDALKSYILKNGLNYELKWYVNTLEIINTWYCYEILGHKFEDVDFRRTNKQLFKIE